MRIIKLRMSERREKCCLLPPCCASPHQPDIHPLPPGPTSGPRPPPISPPASLTAPALGLPTVHLALALPTVPLVLPTVRLALVLPTVPVILLRPQRRIVPRVIEPRETDHVVYYRCLLHHHGHHEPVHSCTRDHLR